jgi:uroporphyrinogen decarboxylase
MADEMTAKERMAALYNRQPTDRVPFYHRGYGFSAKNAGFAIADIYEHPLQSYLAQQRTAEQYHSDGEPFYTFVSYGAWEFGGEIAWPVDRYASGPTVAKRPIERPEDLDELSLPDPRTAGSVPKMLEFAKLQAEHGTQIAFICGSPFTHAANLCGVTTFMKWIIRKPDYVHKAMRLMTDHILSVADVFIEEFGAANILARSAAPSESNGLISPKQFAEFAVPYLQELHSKVLERGVQRIYIHICGEQNLNLPHWQTVKFGDPGMLSFGHEVELAKAAEMFPDQIICGNLDPQIVAKADPDVVYHESGRVIKEGMRVAPGRFLFMGGCDIPANAPAYNVYMMSRAVEDFGRYE